MAFRHTKANNINNNDGDNKSSNRMTGDYDKKMSTANCHQYFLVTLSFIVVSAFFDLTDAICPSECICISDEKRSASCDNSKSLNDIPALLDPRITSLSVRNCSLRRLDTDILELYPDLEFLDLSFNQIEALDFNVFKYQTKLRTLLLNANQLTAIHRENFVGLGNLKILDISQNHVGKLQSSALMELRSLLDLKLSRNQLLTFDADTFAGLISLQRLELSHNNLQTIVPHTFESLSALESLDLSGNNLSTIRPGSFENLESLKLLNLGFNRIESLIESSLQGLASLQYLNLSHNQIERTTSLNLRSLNLLHELDLSSNRFTEVATSSFDGLRSLVKLKLNNQSNLYLVNLNAFSGLSSLREIDLSSCHSLEKIDDNAFEYVDRIERFNLSNCKLQRIPPKLIDWSKLKSLDISGNPLNCDCEMLIFLPQIVRILANTNATCFTPPRLFAKSIVSLSSSCTTLSESQLSLIIVAVSLLLITPLMVAVAFCVRQLRRRRRYSSSRYSEDWRKRVANYRAHLYNVDSNSSNSSGGNSNNKKNKNGKDSSINNSNFNNYNSKPFLIASPLNDKSDLLSEYTCYTQNSSQQSSGNGCLLVSSHQCMSPYLVHTTYKAYDSGHHSQSPVGITPTTYDEEGYYSSVTLNTADSNPYERVRSAPNCYPVAPPAATIPSAQPKAPADDKFRVISEYPVPITEL